MTGGDIFSVRLVVVDFYMHKPTSGLDTCYSEFRGREIKKVPIIRVFGSSATGQKTCMHVHGVFPYFYIPYERKDFDSLNKAIYQIASNVDKAINISLGQGSSNAQHIFKIQLVKGIPFYGYHHREHQFLKIYMFNPRFVRRAANLLQNGSIMGKTFHPFESHVPYILQFMIDFNLYGMSLLHVPFEVVKFRRNNENDEIPHPDVRPGQILSTDLEKKMSTSALEADVSSSFILNRFQLLTKTGGAHANPGIESIWNDERLRRQNLATELAKKEEPPEVPPLEIPASQERPNIQPTESDVFYRTALISKLEALENSQGSGTSGDQSILNNTQQTNISNTTLNATLLGVKERKRTFNLSKFMENAVYPEECSQADNLVNASFIENHLSNAHGLQATNVEKAEPVVPKESDEKFDESVFMDDTILDEELHLHLSQSQPKIPLNASLREEDMKLLQLLEQLEEDNDTGKHVDLDSTLAPLSQSQNINLTPEMLEKVADANMTVEQVTTDDDKNATDELDNDDEEADDSNVLDFSMALDDIDELILKITQSQPEKSADNSLGNAELPQVDGADDLLRTPIKRRSTRVTASSRSSRSPRSPHSQTGSPRTPKYKPLPIVITNRSASKQQQQPEQEEPQQIPKPIIPSRLNLDGKRSEVPLRKRLAIAEMRRKSISSPCELNFDPAELAASQQTKTPARRTRKTAAKDLDKTHITCSLTPPRRRSERILKVYKVQNADDQNTPKPMVVAAINEAEERNDAIAGTSKHTRANAKTMQPAINAQDEMTSTRSGADLLQPIEEKPANEDVIDSLNEQLKTPTVKLRKTPRLSRLSLKRKPSNATPESKAFGNDSNGLTKPPNKEEEEKACDVDVDECPNNDNEEGEEEEANPLIESFYEHSFLLNNSPSVFSDMSSPGLPIVEKGTEDKSEISGPTTSGEHQSNANDLVAITPLELPPTYKEALEGCTVYNLPEFEYQEPFYSDPDDITKRKEIGHTVLHIPGNKLNDCVEFESLLGAELQNINALRRQQLLQLGGSELLRRYGSTQRMREFFASDTSVVAITPAVEPPSRQEAKLWLKARELLSNKQAADGTTKTHTLEEDSPIKVRRQKVTMMLNTMAGDGDADDADMDTSTTCSLSLTPLTPNTPLVVEPEPDSLKTKFTPLTTLNKENDGSASTSKSHVRRFRKQIKRSRRSLSDSLNAAKVEVDQLKEDLHDASSRQNSHSSETSVSSQAALAEMERSSFLQQLQDAGSERSSAHEFSFSLNNTFGFKVNLENLQKAKADIEYTYLTTLTLEVFVATRGDLFPNPQVDEMRCLFYAVEHSVPPKCATSNDLQQKACGYIIVNDAEDIVKEGKIHGLALDIEVQVVPTEIDAIQALLQLCQRWDPDIYAGYEIEMSSWGYVLERSKFLCLNIGPLLSRVPAQKMRDFVDEERDSYTDLDIEMKLCGRILLDVWRLMRSEIALTSYTFENVTYHILHKRCPAHGYRQLTEWFASPCSRWIVLEYYLERVRGTLALLEQLDLIGRTSEMAKLIGIQFYEVFSRGSQFRVESMMLRMAKPKNMVPFSPSVQQRAHMRAPEYLSLIMEPHSRFYADPVIVLDFQSLYPSIIIAYNYCFSSCLGRVEHLGQSTPFEFAASQLRVSPTMLRKLIDHDLITVSPCGVVFVKSSVREGILPRMLTEILDTRQMVKQSMKLHKSNSALQRILHSRQLGLKLMANVTYGYTAANFSGRMPAVEVGDSVVSKGRETLERAIKLVEANEQWNVKVVYGDTDSMFVLVPGRNRAQAFKIGEEIVEAVTQSNPQPIKLKLEKVYQPCILQTKKRYVGYMYETADQAEPVYEAKGIETVRRDGCPIAVKMLEKVLRILFETADVSQVKRYVCRQFTKLLSGRANMQDLIFAKEFRGLNGYKPTACVPALEMTRKWLQVDPRRIPRSGERVPFIIVNGPPGLPLIRLVRSPHELLADEGLKINAVYYITKAIIPPLNRCLLLIGADANEWFGSLPRKILLTPALSSGSHDAAQQNKPNSTAMDVFGQCLRTATKKSTISQYYSTTNCIMDCGRQTKQTICATCSSDPLKKHVLLQMKIGKIERAYHLTQHICQACCGRVGDLQCESLDCPVVYVLETKRRDLKQIPHLQSLLSQA